MLMLLRGIFLAQKHFKHPQSQYLPYLKSIILQTALKHLQPCMLDFILHTGLFCTKVHDFLIQNLFTHFFLHTSSWKLGKQIGFS
jgi:hypothetical protein